MGRGRSWLVLIVVVALVASGCGNGADDDGGGGDGDGGVTELSIRLDWTALGYHAPLLIAEEKGWFEEEDLSVDIGEGQGSATTCQVVANEQDDVGWADFTACAPLIANGAPIKAVTIVAQQTPLVVVTKAESGITEPSDLEGHSVGVAPGGSDQQALPVFLEAAGVDESRVKVNTFDAAAKTQVFVDGRVDAIVALVNAQVPQIEKLGIAINRIPLADYVSMPSYSVFVNDSMIEDNPEAVSALVKATLRGWDYTATHPGEAIDLLAEEFPDVERDIAMRQLQETLGLLHTERTADLPVGVASEEDILETEELLGETVDLEVTGEVSTYYTDEFLPKDE